MAHVVGFYIHTGHQLLDLAGPLDAFHAANEAAGRDLYALRIFSHSGGTVRGHAGARMESMIAAERGCDTLIVIGGNKDRLRHPDEVEAIRRLAGAASRIASVCTGAFLLAQAGFLDGRRATTHWSCTRRLQEAYPSVIVEPDRIFTSDGPVWTSAGVSAGIDLALAMIEADHGTDLARAVARELVVYYRRPGGQSQFSTMADLEPKSDRMRDVLSFMREHLSEPLPVERLADAAHLSLRQFGRLFREETGETPSQAVERLRVEAARVRLRDGIEPIEQIAAAVGFTDPERMRRAFVKRFGHPPQAVRRLARALPA